METMFVLTRIEEEFMAGYRKREGRCDKIWYGDNSFMGLENKLQVGGEKR